MKKGKDKKKRKNLSHQTRNMATVMASSDAIFTACAPAPDLPKTLLFADHYPFFSSLRENLIGVVILVSCLLVVLFLWLYPPFLIRKSPLLSQRPPVISSQPKSLVYSGPGYDTRLFEEISDEEIDAMEEK